MERQIIKRTRKLSRLKSPQKGESFSTSGSFCKTGHLENLFLPNFLSTPNNTSKFSCFCWKRKCLGKLASEKCFYSPRKLLIKLCWSHLISDTLQLLISKITSKYLKVFLAEHFRRVIKFWHKIQETWSRRQALTGILICLKGEDEKLRMIVGTSLWHPSHDTKVTKNIFCNKAPERFLGFKAFSKNRNWKGCSCESKCLPYCERDYS